MKSHRPVGGYGFGLRLFSPDFIPSITQIQPENNHWLTPTQALSFAYLKAQRLYGLSVTQNGRFLLRKAN